MVLAATAGATACAARGAAQSAAQAVPARVPCAGDTVSAIDIRVRPASSGPVDDALEATSDVVGVDLRFPVTRPEVVRAYMRIAVGDVCTPSALDDSERMLRAQRFIARAAIRTTRDGRNRVRLTVTVVDESPIHLTGGLRRGSPASIAIGSQNFGGRGLEVILIGTRGFAYRDGYGARLVQHGLLGRAAHVALEGQVRPLGHRASLEFVEPFLTDFKRHAFRAGVREVTDYYRVLRPEQDNVALRTRLLSYDLGWVRRIGDLNGRKTVGLLGAAVLGAATHTSTDARILSDSGIVDAPDAVFSVRYPRSRVLRAGIIGGVRAVRFMTVSGFDALSAQQDLGVGTQFSVLLAPSVKTAQQHDLLVATDVYAGAGDGDAFVSARFNGEARVTYDGADWDSFVASARISGYMKGSRVRTHVATIDVAGIRDLGFPAQLTYRDPDGGLAGFRPSRAAGGWRGIVRLEERRAVPWFRPRAELALAAFAEAGRLWAGDVPYGRTTPVRAALGLSLLGAYPSGTKRIYRVDVAFPLNAERGRWAIGLRVTSADRTALHDAEPRDVARLRSGAVPATLMKW
jgi:hypothetical protein